MRGREVDRGRIECEKGTSAERERVLGGRKRLTGSGLTM